MVKAVTISPGNGVILKLFAEVSGSLHQFISRSLVITAGGGWQVPLILGDIPGGLYGRLISA